MYALNAITLLSGVVYGHHMYATSMSPLLGRGFMLLTMLVSVPATVLFLNWMGTLWRGRLRHEPVHLDQLIVGQADGLPEVLDAIPGAGHRSGLPPRTAADRR